MLKAVEKMEFKMVEGKGSGSLPVYADKHNNQYDACEEDLFDYVRVQVLGRIGDLFLLVGQDNCEELEAVGAIFRLLISDAEKKLERVFDLLEGNVGRLTIHSLSKGYPWHDDALPLGVFLKTKEEKDRQKEEWKAQRDKDLDPLKLAESDRKALVLFMGNLKAANFDTERILKDLLAGKAEVPIEQYKTNGSGKAQAKAPTIPLTGKTRKGNGKGVQAHG